MQIAPTTSRWVRGAHPHPRCWWKNERQWQFVPSALHHVRFFAEERVERRVEADPPFGVAAAPAPARLDARRVDAARVAADEDAEDLRRGDERRTAGVVSASLSDQPPTVLAGDEGAALALAKRLLMALVSLLMEKDPSLPKNAVVYLYIFHFQFDTFLIHSFCSHESKMNSTFAKQIGRIEGPRYYSQTVCVRADADWSQGRRLPRAHWPWPA